MHINCVERRLFFRKGEAYNDYLLLWKQTERSSFFFVAFFRCIIVNSLMPLLVLVFNFFVVVKTSLNTYYVRCHHQKYCGKIKFDKPNASKIKTFLSSQQPPHFWSNYWRKLMLRRDVETLFLKILSSELFQCRKKIVCKCFSEAPYRSVFRQGTDLSHFFILWHNRLSSGK